MANDWGRTRVKTKTYKGRTFKEAEAMLALLRPNPRGYRDEFEGVVHHEDGIPGTEVRLGMKLQMGNFDEAYGFYLEGKLIAELRPRTDAEGREYYFGHGVDTEERSGAEGWKGIRLFAFALNPTGTAYGRGYRWKAMAYWEVDEEGPAEEFGGRQPEQVKVTGRDDFI